ncbi:WGR domain-containing protein [Pseudaminobacter arsenicus]|uniref:WGR domain-containing protein n=2 Tax=Borborobacter arsenicus TaxID=1851146 RepID=A0A432V0U2_9HYPH|nr:WGR domain-containing protein [Pseudaminobacter arsenicus]
MATPTHSCLLDRIARERNMARFYELSVKPTLFGEVALVRRWGRIGTWGRQRIDIHPHGHAALAALEDIARTKHKRGYRPRV